MKISHLEFHNVKVNMKYKILKESEIQDLLNDYYENKYTIKRCVEKYASSKSTIINLLKKRGTGGRSRDDYNNNIYQCDESFFEQVDSHEKAYWFGFIAADGNIYNQKLQIALNEKDEEHLIKFCKRIGYTGVLYDDRTIKRLMICRKKIVLDLKKLGLIENKTLLIDETIFDQIPKEYLRSCILGYIDGDGSFYYSGKYLNFSIVGNEKFLIFLRKYFCDFGIKLSTPKKDKRTKQTFYSYSRLNKEYIDSLLNILYKDASEDFLERKQNKLLIHESRIVKI